MKKLLLLSFIILVTATGCRDIFGKRIRGNGHITTETRHSSSFHSVDVSGAIKIFVKYDSVNSIKVEADENLHEYIDVHNENGTLHIHEADNVNLRTTRGIRVYVAGPDFKRFEASGACDIYSENKISSASGLEIDLSGASEVKMELGSPSVHVKVSGAGTVDLKGETRDFTVRGSGSTEIKSFGLMAENVTVSISGAGDADVFASVKLDVSVSGAGSVRYKGNPAISQKMSGAGNIKKVD